MLRTEEKEEYDPSGKRTYSKTCEILGIIPTRYFLRTIENSMTQVNMSHHGVGPRGAKAIAMTLIVSLLIAEPTLVVGGLALQIYVHESHKFNAL